MTFAEQDISLILRAVRFSAEKHKNQRRKGVEGVPYINHPIAVAELLWTVGEVRDVNVICGAILHDTVEDTGATPAELAEHFGSAVSSLVLEVSDDKSLPKSERKRLQIEHAPHLSAGAKQIKLADKISNINDVAGSPPADWPLQRRIDYLAWADSVVSGLRGSNKKLEQLFDESLSRARVAVVG